MRTLILATTLLAPLALSGVAHAQTPTPGTSQASGVGMNPPVSGTIESSNGAPIGMNGGISAGVGTQLSPPNANGSTGGTTGSVETDVPAGSAADPKTMTGMPGRR